ncbi:hypothetical protein DCO58_01520 [Helicobacter saguini]|uniref:DUF6792 domain-containing protein n=2 Tax=Helicobacter saguini TaxID=1548018 RepID=A0A347W105_9HELI|nr:hypothetical protein [Helicobacter saguini]MWV66392.1 hypothetical protein [Helicobacter saguini]MWV68744.1 hypothetical protein [Helicobacter saguini]MWV71703.1 hypothetical protein [Helicobacter saguini]TLD91888.1 hypothetical protein LS64_011215 [Helicobacter saguini]
MLHYTNKKYKFGDNEESDGLKLGDKLKDFKTNTTYARAIEARFQKDKIYKTTLGFIHSTLDNNPTNVSLKDSLSKDTIDFTNRYRLLHHQENTSSGFSATLFEDTQDSNQKIFAIRGTEAMSDFLNDVIYADMNLMFGKLATNQYLDMLRFYNECVEKYPNITKPKNLNVVGHSLGGCLAQLLALNYN